MLVLYTPYCTEADPADFRRLMPPARRERLHGDSADQGPLTAYALLSLALHTQFGLAAAHTLDYTPEGKPYLPGLPVFLSISHGKTHALAALSSSPVGADIETHRPISTAVLNRVLSPEESPDRFFDHWVLKESCIKLHGKRSVPLHRLAFRLDGGLAQGVGHQAFGYCFDEIPGCSAAVCAHDLFPRPQLQQISPHALAAFAGQQAES